MDPMVMEWLSLALRWAHIVAAIAWIGSSFFFMWLDSHLTPPEQPRNGIHGELWMVHSGGFYQVEKYMVAPERMPKTLHWFKWEAYFTWITGILLLTVLYYFGAAAYLVRPGSEIHPLLAVGIGVAVLVGGWLVYDALCRSPLGRNEAAFGIVGFLLVTALAWGLGHVFSGRGTFIHIGAMLATLMAVNVFHVIIPNQRKLVAATIAGQPRDPTLGALSKQRSVHNNYMTLPVIFTMISNHYPMTFSPAWNWAILAGLALIGAGTRHYFNRRNAGANPVWILPTAAVALIALALVASPRAPAPTAEAASGPVPFASVETIIGQRCATCHSAHPTDPAFEAPPNGVAFDTAHEIASRAELIFARAVATDSMPLGNVTSMTEDERALLGLWIRQGAAVE